MVVVSDTSVISNLWQIGHISVLSSIFSQILIPAAVEAELLALDSFSDSTRTGLEWLVTHRVQEVEKVSVYQAKLDLGEAESIAMAKEKKADLLLMDEAKGRKIAKQEGIEVTGLLGILLAAKSRGYVNSVTLLMDRLISEVGFRIGDQLYQQVKQEARE